MRMLPDMTIICPGDAWEVRLALRAAIQHKGPVFIRLGKKGEPVIHKQAPEFAIGKGIIISEGSDVCLLSTGNMLPVAVNASEELRMRGVSARVVSFHTVKPLDEDLLNMVFSRFKVVATIEEHSLIGGFGSSVADWLVDRGSMQARLLRIGTADTFIHEAGKQKDFQERFGLTADSIADKVLKYLQS
jgi:transketolase